MGKNTNNKNNKNRTPPPQRTPPVPPAPVAARPEPTEVQVVQLDEAEKQVDTFTAEQGVPTVDGIHEPVGPTLAECLLRVADLLAKARAHFERARDREAAARAEEERLAAQKRDHEDAFKRAKRDADEAHAARKQELDRSEDDLLRRIEAAESREDSATTLEAALRSRDAKLVERAAGLTERELDAERGFLADKVRVLKPLESEVARLREERDRLEAELGERRAQAEAEARTRASERAERWAQEDGRRTAREAELRRSFDEEVTRTRQETLAKLRTTLQAERQTAEADWQTKLAARTAELDARASGLEARAQTITERTVKLRCIEQDLKTEQELLAEDRAALDRKVARLVAERSEELRHGASALKQQLDDARAQRDVYFADLEARRELDRRFGSRTPEQILADLLGLERERDSLSQQLRERPDAHAAARLTALERERSAWLEERAVLHGDLAYANGELATRRLAAIELEALKKQKEALEVHKQLLDGAVDELHTRVDELTRQEDHRNPMTALTSLDDKEELQGEVRTTPPFGRATPSLREFADDLRHRIANGVEGRTLYYAERDVRAFLGGLAMTRLMLLQGISGTGKTSLPLAFADAVGGGIEVIEVQAGWRDRQDLVGYYNAFHRHYYATNFLQALYKAGTPAYRDRLFLMVLDEINLSRPEQFFADFLSALEQPIDARRLTLVNDPLSNAPRLLVDGRHLPIPPNVWFVGTANHDESTAEFADKTYDRAHVMEMPRKTEAAHFVVQDRGKRSPISYNGLDSAFAEAAAKQGDAVAKATTWLRSAPFARTMEDRFRVGWGNRLENQLARYLPVVVEAGGTVGEAMDHLLVTKVLRKLKDRHDVRVNALEGLREQLFAAWATLDNANLPERCDALIAGEIAAKKGEEQA